MSFLPSDCSAISFYYFTAFFTGVLRSFGSIHQSTVVSAKQKPMGRHRLPCGPCVGGGGGIRGLEGDWTAWRTVLLGRAHLDPPLVQSPQSVRRGPPAPAGNGHQMMGPLPPQGTGMVRREVRMGQAARGRARGGERLMGATAS